VAPLLERDEVLGELDRALAAAIGGSGSVVVVEGPAGIGKSAILEAFVGTVGDDVMVVAQGCDDLTIPRELGPFRDACIEGILPADSVADVESLRQHLLDHTTQSPVVIAIDDLHWADDATLDVVRFLGRRIASFSMLLVLTRRNEEAAASLGDLRAEQTHVLTLPPLSPSAVQSLLASGGDDGGPSPSAAELHHLTGGNPFLVTEAIRSPDGLSPSIRDHVAMDLSRLGTEARAVADLLATTPGGVTWDIVERLSDDWAVAVDELERSGLAVSGRSGVRYRHELFRRTAEKQLTGAARRRCHTTLLGILEDTDADPALIAHHAAEIGDALRLIPASTAAAQRAADAGAHTEAVRHIERLLGFADRLEPADRARLYEIASREYEVTNRLEEAEVYARRYLELELEVGDASAISRAYGWLSRVQWLLTRYEDARRSLDQAVAVLDDEPGTPESVRRAIDNAVNIAHRSRWNDALRWVDRALVQAEALGEPLLLAQALVTSEMVRAVVDRPERAALDGDRGIELMREAGPSRELWIALGNRVARSLNLLRLDDYRAAHRAAAELASQVDVASFTDWMAGQEARYALLTGDWAEAGRLATPLLDSTPVGIHRVTPLLVDALLRGRCDAPDAAPLDEAAELIAGLDDIQRIGAQAAAEAELAWLGLRFDPGALDRTIELADRGGFIRYGAEAAVWNRRLGREPAPDFPDAPAPFAAELGGRWQEAADAWTELGCPYQRTLCLAFSADAEAMREAVVIAGRLGADRTADRIRQMMREQGVRSRGPQRATRSNPAGLTNRQMDVAALLVEGLTNQEIAERLFVSEKTVDHHVSAVLSKLGVADRHAAASRFRELTI
jgi:DNA-binding CsgD family transcriptional regulator/tetratricopeptide (TPR) repeat protein